MENLPSMLDDVPTDEKSSRVWNLLIIIVVIMAFSSVLMVLFKGESDIGGNQHPQVGKKLVGLAFKPLTGTDKELTDKDLRGKVSLISFWGTWCPPCRYEFPHLAGIEAKPEFRNDKRFLFVSAPYFGGGINDYETLEKETTKFLLEQQVSHPTYWDPGGRSIGMLGELLKYEVAFPTTVILDHEGIIRGIWIGYNKGAEKQMEALISELQKKVPE